LEKYFVESENETKGSQVGSLEKFTSHSAKNDLPIVQIELCTDR
jgi:hypothetical protein